MLWHGGLTKGKGWVQLASLLSKFGLLKKVYLQQTWLTLRVMARRSAKVPQLWIKNHFSASHLADTEWHFIAFQKRILGLSCIAAALQNYYLRLLPRNPFWRGVINTVGLLVITNTDQVLFALKNIFFLFLQNKLS